MSAPPIDSSKLLADIVRSAFEHHKNHARFQEIQRRWLNVTFLTATSATLYFLGNGNRNLLFDDDRPRRLFWLCPPEALAAIAFVFVFIVWSAVLIRFLRAIAGAGVSNNDVKC